MNETPPSLRRDLEFFPVYHGREQLILVRDHLGLVQEGHAVALPLYQFMISLDGSKTIRDLQMELMRQRGGLLVGSNEVMTLVDHLDQGYLLDSERFHKAREGIEKAFTGSPMRHCSHSGSAYPSDPAALRDLLNGVLKGQTSAPEKRIRALISPHIDISVGSRIYGAAYGSLRHTAPSRVILLGVGHRMMEDLFCLTDKDFLTPLGVVRADKPLIEDLREAGKDTIAGNDFAHRTEHSIEFQLIFLQHIFRENPFSIVPILCGSCQTNLGDYGREAYLSKAKPLLEVLQRVLREDERETLLVAGVDLSHIGPKFGHDRPARSIEGQSEAHDRRLLEAITVLRADRFWEESIRVQDQYHVCGFSALACMLEILPPCQGQILDYQVWHEGPTQSAVSFAAAVFT